MKIKILNRNNSSEYVVEEGAVIVENYNETLDSANVKISHQTSKIDISPFDIVKLIDDRFGVKYFCVDNYVELEECLNPKIYSYDINLFSETKLLEGIILPNLSITPRKIGTKRNIYEVLTEYLDNYGQKVTRLGGLFTNKWHFADRVEDKFSQIDCPELQWNQPTLREVFNDLMMVKDCIVVMHNNEIDYIDLTEKKKDLRNDTSRLVEKTLKEKLDNTGYIINSFDAFISSEEKEVSDLEMEIISGSGTPSVEYDDVLKLITYEISGGTPNDNVEIKISYEITPDISIINYTQTSQDSSNYASELKMNLQNVLQTGTTETNNVVSTGEYLTFTTEQNVATDDNIILKTKFPILNIKHLWMNFFCSTMTSPATNPVLIPVQVDLMKLRAFADDVGKYFSIVKESSEYETLKTLYTINSFYNLNEFTGKVEDFCKYQNGCIKYTRGSNIISGFSNVNKKTAWFGTKLSLSTIVDIAYETAREDDIISQYTLNCPITSRSWWVFGDEDVATSGYFTPTFKIEYETTANCVFSASKEDYPDNEKIVFDNQTNSWVDVETQGNLEYQKANRIGNQNLMFNQRTNDFDKAIKIGDFRDDNVVYQTQYQIYKHHIEVNANATKNYILKNYYTGVNSKIRTWVNAQEEAFERHELFKYYIEVNNQPTDYVYDLDANFYDNFVKIAPYAEPKPIKNCIITANSQKILNDSIIRIIGKSIVVTTKIDDSWVLCKTPDTDEIASSNLKQSELVSIGPASIYYPPVIYKTKIDNYGGIPLLPHKYVNDNGECSSITIEFTNDFDNNTPLWFSNVEAAKQYYYKLLKRPFVQNDDEYSSVFSKEITYLKDNKEIPAYSFQFEYSSGNKNIILGNKFVKLLKAVRIEDVRIQKYTFKLNGETISCGLDYTLGDNVLKITGVENMDENDVLTIEYDGELVLQTNTNTLYFNVLKTKNHNVYFKNSDGEWIKIGGIYS